jgi:hypothetical protein
MAIDCGCSSVVERHLAKVNVARSNRVTRFQLEPLDSFNFKRFSIFRVHPVFSDSRCIRVNRSQLS